MRHFDLCVIGSGPAGQRCAIQAAKLGKSVIIVERMSVVGGVAINTGTIPSKALREAVLDVTDPSSHRPQAPIERSKKLEELHRSCYRVIDEEIKLIQKQLVSNGIEVAIGTGSFVDEHTVEIVDGDSSEEVRADYIMVSVGTKPARPETIPFDGVNVFCSDELLRMQGLPYSMIVVGGGVIGTEYASMLGRLGVKVTLVEGRARLLDFIDSEITEALQYHLRQEGVTLRLGENVTKVSLVDPPQYAKTQNKQMVEAVLESGKTLRADSLLYCIGRQGATDSLNLEAAGLKADNRGRLKVNASYQTEVPHIFAGGDVIGFPALASTSMEQGRLAACSMFGCPSTAHADLFPYGIYSIPEISMVGWTEDRLTEEGIPYEVGVAQYREIARGQLLGDQIGMLKMIIHPETRHILGVHVIGTGATELIHIGQAVMAFNGTVDYFVNTVFNYPTLAECYKVAAMNGVNKLMNV